MPPRQRGIPRRGGVWGIRGRQEAQAIQPVAMMEPQSSPSEESEQLDSQVHTSRCTFRCRRNQTRLSLLITVLATEEEDDSSSYGELEQTNPARAQAMKDNTENEFDVDITVMEPPPELRAPQQPTQGWSQNPAPGSLQLPVYSGNQLTNNLEPNEEIHKPGIDLEGSSRRFNSREPSRNLSTPSLLKNMDFTVSAASYSGKANF